MLKQLQTKVMLLVTLLLAGAGSMWADTVTDKLTRETTGVTGTTYSDWSGVSVTSDAVYKGQSAGGNESIQMRSNNSNSGIVTTASGGKLVSISVNWNENTTQGRTLNVYGKNAAYAAATDLYNSNNQGELIGTLVYDGNNSNNTLTINGDYEYVGVRSSSGALWLNYIEFTWETESEGPVLEANDLALTNAPVALEWNLYESSDAKVISYTTSSTGAVTVEENSSINAVVDASAKTITVTPVAVTSGTVTVNVKQEADDSYKAGSTSFTVNIVNSDPNAPGSENNPYTVAQARAAIDANEGITDVYVKGIVSEIAESFSAQFGNISYNISDDGSVDSDQLQAYRGKSYNGDSFTSDDDIQVGDEVVVYGTLQYYQSKDLYEFKAGNQLVSLKRAEDTTPSVTVATTSVELKAAESEGTINVTAKNITDAGLDVFFCNANGGEATYDWLTADINDEGNLYYFAEANTGAERTAYLKVYGLDEEANEVYSDMITFTQAEYVEVVDYATLPFEFNGGIAEIANTNGLTQEGLGSDYKTDNTKLKFDSTGDYLVLKINEAPGTLTFDIKGNSFSGGNFHVQTSTDGENYTNFVRPDIPSDETTMTYNNLPSDVRYIKWIYTEKSSGNVGIGNITLAKAGDNPQPVVATITVNNNNISLSSEAEEGTIEVTYQNVETSAGVEVKFYDAEGKNEATCTWMDVDIDDDLNIFYMAEANDGAERTAYLKVYGLDAQANDVYSELITITQAKYVAPEEPIEAGVGYFVKVTSNEELTDGSYLIVYEGAAIAFDGGREKLDAAGNIIGVSISNDRINATETAVKAVFAINVTNGTIKSASGQYIGQTSDANGLLSSEETAYANTISIDDEGNADIEAESGARLRLNAASNQARFRYYRSSSYNNQQAIQLYKYDKDASYGDEVVTITAAGLATYVSDNALDYSNVEGLKAYKASVEGDVVTFVKVDKVPAGEGVLLRALNELTEDATFTVPVIAEAPTLTGNAFVRGTGMAVESEENGFFNYILNKNNNVLGFYKAAGKVVDKNRAYLQTASANVRAAISFDDAATAISDVKAAERSGEVYDLQGRRVSTLKSGLYIVNGKKMVINK